MKVVILAGGFGSRLGELTTSIPKPMIPLLGKPLLLYIIEHYSKFGYNDFVIACGFKSEIIKSFFLNYKSFCSDFTVDFSNDSVIHHSSCTVPWKVTLVDSGLDAMTGGRLLSLKKYLGDKPFMLTYGDGISDVSIDKLSESHSLSNSIVTITAVKPQARFGGLTIMNDKVIEFKEKPEHQMDWINGGYMVCQPDIFSYIHSQKTVLETDVLGLLAAESKLSAFKHTGFWQCVDTPRDITTLETSFYIQSL